MSDLPFDFGYIPEECKDIGNHCLFKIYTENGVSQYFAIVEIPGSFRYFRCFAITEEEYEYVKGQKEFDFVLGNDAEEVPEEPYRHWLVWAEVTDDDSYSDYDRIWFTDLLYWKETPSGLRSSLFIPWIGKEIEVRKLEGRKLLLCIDENRKVEYSVRIGRPYMTAEEFGGLIMKNEEQYWIDRCLEEKKEELLGSIDDNLDVRYPGKFIRKSGNLLVNEENDVRISKKGLTPGIYAVTHAGVEKTMNTAEVISFCKTLHIGKEIGNGGSTESGRS